MTWTVTIDAVSYEDQAIEGVSIYTGREEIDRQPNPSTASVRLVRDSTLGSINPENWPYAAPVVVTYGASRVRFVGQLVDVNYDRYTITLTAVSDAARWPSVKAVFGLAPFIIGPTYDVIRYNGDAIGTLSSSITASTALDTGEGESALWYDDGFYEVWPFLQACTAAEPSGVLFDDITTNPVTLTFHDATRRRNTTPDITLTGDEILDDWVIGRQNSDKANQSTVTTVENLSYGWPATTEVETIESDVTTYGPYTADIAPSYATPASAVNAGRAIVGLRWNPMFRLRRLTIPLDALSAMRRETLLDDIRISALVDIPTIANYTADGFFIEGWNESFGQKQHVITVFLSDSRLTHPPDRWIDVDPTLTWAGVSNTMTWADAYAERFT